MTGVKETNQRSGIPLISYTYYTEEVIEKIAINPPQT